jgi:gluconate 2-dehydrogenase gamma chain
MSRDEGPGTRDPNDAATTDAEQSSVTSAPSVSSAVHRRDMVKMLALAPLAGVLEFTGIDVDRAARKVAALKPPGAAGSAFAPAFFDAHEWETVRVLVDYVIPKDARSGSATDAKVPEFMDFILADADASPAARIGIRGGLAWLDAESTKRFGKEFVAASDAERRRILDDIAWPEKARPEMSHGVAFFNRFRDFTASGFFSSSVGFEDLKYMGNTFVPEWTGCPPEALAKLGVSYSD